MRARSVRLSRADEVRSSDGRNESHSLGLRKAEARRLPPGGLVRGYGLSRGNSKDRPVAPAGRAGTRQSSSICGA
jgi:hypothetical protein